MRVKFSIDIKDTDTLNMAMLSGLLESPDPLTVYEGRYYYDSEITRTVYALLASMNLVHSLTVVDEEAEQAKWKLNMPTKEGVHGTGSWCSVNTLELNSAIEQMVTEQVNRILNSDEYKRQMLNTIYSVLLTEHLYQPRPFTEHPEKD